MGPQDGQHVHEWSERGEDSRIPESEPSTGALWWALVLRGGPADPVQRENSG